MARGGAELLLAAVGTLVFSCVVYFPLKLGGLWVTWWLCYFCTLSIGIGERLSPDRKSVV